MGLQGRLCMGVYCRGGVFGICFCYACVCLSSICYHCRAPSLVLRFSHLHSYPGRVSFSSLYLLSMPMSTSP
jgi:hypothetical protein